MSSPQDRVQNYLKQLDGEVSFPLCFAPYSRFVLLSLPFLASSPPALCSPRSLRLPIGSTHLSYGR